MQWENSVAANNLRSNNDAVDGSSNGLRQIAKTDGVSEKSPMASARLLESDVEKEKGRERGGETPKKTRGTDVAETSVNYTSTPIATPNVNAEVDKVPATEGGEGGPNESNQNLETNQIDQNVENPNAKAREKWEQLWREKVEVYSDAISEDEKRSAAEKKILAFNHSESNFWPLNRLMETFPTPTREDSLALYNEATYNGLISRLLEAQSANRKIKIVATGGSATAGFGRPRLTGSDRYFARFTNYLKTILSVDASSPATIEYIDQGHNARNSLHTAVLYDNFVPADVDLLIWEFSINDGDEKNETIQKISAKQSFLALMNHIDSLENPPFVMLLYYWDAPWTRDPADCSVFGSSFDANGDLPRRFDFVVGHANMGSYPRELELKSACNRKNNPFLSDQHHPSRMGHMTSAFLLLQLLRPNGTFLKPPVSSGDSRYEWTCGTETPAKQTLKSVITNSTGGWKSPVGSWTLEVPVYSQSSLSTTTVLIPARPFVNIEDARKKGRFTPLGLCSSSSEDAFTLLVGSNNKPMRNIKALLLILKNKEDPPLLTGDIHVQLNGDLNASGELVPMYISSRKDDLVYNWPCHFSCTCAFGFNVDMYWYILDSIQPSVHSVKICTTLSSTKIENLAIW